MAQGTYQSLLEKGIDFVSLMESGESSNDAARRVSVGKVEVEVSILPNSRKFCIMDSDFKFI